MFIDQLTPSWLKGQLAGKPVAFFCSAGSMHGGEEATLISTMIPFFNLGMIPVGIPYPIAGESPDFDSGSPYGAIFVSGHKGENQLSEGDMKVARMLGKRLASFSHLLNCDCQKCSVFKQEMQKLLV
jgi:NAD(P)H dehydrogenase (quinone)